MQEYKGKVSNFITLTLSANLLLCRKIISKPQKHTHTTQGKKKLTTTTFETAQFKVLGCVLLSFRTV